MKNLKYISVLLFCCFIIMGSYAAEDDFLYLENARLISIQKKQERCAAPFVYYKVVFKKERGGYLFFYLRFWELNEDTYDSFPPEFREDAEGN